MNTKATVGVIAESWPYSSCICSRCWPGAKSQWVQRQGADLPHIVGTNRAHSHRVSTRQRECCSCWLHGSCDSSLAASYVLFCDCATRHMHQQQADHANRSVDEWLDDEFASPA
jgi:hypothetical protein